MCLGSPCILLIFNKSRKERDGEKRRDNWTDPEPEPGLFDGFLVSTFVFYLSSAPELGRALYSGPF